MAVGKPEAGTGVEENRLVCGNAAFGVVLGNNCCSVAERSGLFGASLLGFAISSVVCSAILLLTDSFLRRRFTLSELSPSCFNRPRSIFRLGALI